MRRLVWVSLVLSACAGASEQSSPAAAPEATPAPAPADPKPPPGSVWREDVTATIDEGLGYFLQRVEVEAVVQAGRFEGFRIVSLFPPQYWDGVDLKPGDVITAVNGMPIERETEAYAAFESLRTAEAIRVQYRRAGAERELTYAIIDKPGESKAKPSAPPARPAPERAADAAAPTADPPG